MVKEFSLHRIFLVAICTFALPIFALPIPQEGGYPSAVVAFLILVAVYALVFRLKGNKALYYAVAAVSVILAAVQIGIVSDFFSGYVLPNTPKLLITALFAAAVGYGVLCKNEAILKFSLISLPFIVAAVLLILFLSFEKITAFDWSAFIIPKGDNFLAGALKYGVLFIPALLLPFHSEQTHKSLKNDIMGLLIGFAVFSVCFWNVAAFFSGGNDINFPYYHVAEILSAGGMFTRQTGFLYAVFFVVSFIKVSLLIQTLKPVLNNTGKKAKKAVLIAAVSVSAALSFLF